MRGRNEVYIARAGGRLARASDTVYSSLMPARRKTQHKKLETTAATAHELANDDSTLHANIGPRDVCLHKHDVISHTEYS